MTQEKIYLTEGRTKRTAHKDPDCPRLGGANKVIEKPASVIPDGFFDECDWCHGNVAGNGRELEEE